jgi:predicted RNase H-like nuclease (RuvC/YqgF family)
MKQSTDAYIERLKAQLIATETALYNAKMSAQEVNTRKNVQIAELQAEIDAGIELVKKFQEERDELNLKIDEMAGDIMTLENRIGTMTGYGHN